MPIRYDLVLKGGEVIDPAQGLQATRDIAFKDGKVAAVTGAIPETDGAEVIDVIGKLVTPGLIDSHGHFAYKFVPSRADPDAVNLTIGVTTAVDAGSSGSANFAGFRTYVMERVDTRLFAFLHLSAVGQTIGVGLGLPDLEDFRHVREEETMRCIEANRDLILGVKVRLTPSGTTLKNAVPALEAARRITDATGTRIMAHVYESPIPMAKVFEYLKPGDFATHIFHDDTHSILDENRSIRPEARQAYESGIIFDTASMPTHSSIAVSRTAIEAGMPPHTLSTDRVGDDHPRARWQYDLLGIMSMYLGLGMSLDDVVRCVTANAASAIGHEELGRLDVGGVGDAAVLELEEGNFRYEDGLGNEVSTERRFAPVLTVKDGKRWRPR